MIYHLDDKLLCIKDCDCRDLECGFLKGLIFRVDSPTNSYGDNSDYILLRRIDGGYSDVWSIKKIRQHFVKIDNEQQMELCEILYG